MKRASPLFGEEDADLSASRWCLNNWGYATRHQKGAEPSTQAAHRVVMERVAGRRLSPDEIVDHINADKMDNRRENLRVTDRAGNAQHRAGVNVNNSSGFRGVTFNKPKGLWQAHVRHAGRMLHVGWFSTAEEARDAAAAKRRELGFLGEAPCTEAVKAAFGGGAT